MISLSRPSLNALSLLYSSRRLDDCVRAGKGKEVGFTPSPMTQTLSLSPSLSLSAVSTMSGRLKGWIEGEGVDEVVRHAVYRTGEREIKT